MYIEIHIIKVRNCFKKVSEMSIVSLKSLSIYHVGIRNSTNNAKRIGIHPTKFARFNPKFQANTREPKEEL